MADKIEMVRCIISQREHAGKLETKPRIEINGKAVDYALDVVATIPLTVAKVARDTGLNVTILPDAEETPSPASDGNGDAAAGEAPGGETGGSETPFDAEAVIAGTVHDVEDRLVNLTLDQLDAVARAEQARENPRGGVLNAVAKARKAFASDA